MYNICNEQIAKCISYLVYEIISCIYALVYIYFFPQQMTLLPAVKIQSETSVEI